MFEVGNQYGKRSKRGKGIDQEMKDKIRGLADGLIENIDIQELTTNQRIALLKALIPYVLPKDTSIEEDTETDTVSPPAIIVFGDTEEYKAYQELFTEE